MPKVSSSIFEAMDRVAKEAADTISKMSTNNNNDDASTDDNKVILASRTHGHDQGLFQKLEVSMRKNQCCQLWRSIWNFIARGFYFLAGYTTRNPHFPVICNRNLKIQEKNSGGMK